MLELLFLAIVVIWLYRSIQSLSPGQKTVVPARKQSPQLAQALDFAGRLYKEHKFLQAEKAYLNVLRLDHRNLTAYSRLGMIYAALKNYPDAIECLEIACQIEPSAAHYHNLGLALLENRNHVKAVAALEKAIMFQPTAHRYASLAKAYRRTSSYPKAVAALEKAVELEADRRYLTLLADAYAISGNASMAAATRQRIVKGAKKATNLGPEPQVS